VPIQKWMGINWCLRQFVRDTPGEKINCPDNGLWIFRWHLGNIPRIKFSRNADSG
jgi:hypothetical protein